MASVVVYLASEWIHILLQIAMFLFHYSRLRLVDGTKSNRSSAKVCKIITIVRVSYLIFIAYTIRLAIPAFMVSINVIHPYLDDTICYFAKRGELSMIILGRTLVHLFVAMRSRFGSRSTSKNKWYKLGLSFLFLDILLFGYISSPLLAIQTGYIDGQCVTQSLTPIVLLWLAFNDLFIGIYSLFAFILPLRRLILNNNKENVQDLTDLIKRIVVYSIIALFITILSILITMMTPVLGAFLSPLSSTVTVYCIIMQFSNIPLRKIKSQCLRLIVAIFQLSCKQYMVIKHENNMIMMDKIHAKDAKTDTNDNPNRVSSDNNKERMRRSECKNAGKQTPETEITISTGFETPTLPKGCTQMRQVPSTTTSETV